MDEYAYRKLEVWQKAMDLVDAIYAVARQLPAEERFGLNPQMRRSVTSVPSNIAEGYGRNHRKEYIQHLYVARGSLMEIETQLIVCVRQSFIGRDLATEVWQLMQEVGRKLSRLIQSLS